jgi:hypothetical protein
MYIFFIYLFLSFQFTFLSFQSPLFPSFVLFSPSFLVSLLILYLCLFFLCIYLSFLLYLLLLFSFFFFLSFPHHFLVGYVTFSASYLPDNLCHKLVCIKLYNATLCHQGRHKVATCACYQLTTTCGSKVELQLWTSWPRSVPLQVQLLHPRTCKSCSVAPDLYINVS